MVSSVTAIDWMGGSCEKGRCCRTSRSFTVESSEGERMLFPGEMIPVAVIARVCERSDARGGRRRCGCGCLSGEVSGEDFKCKVYACGEQHAKGGKEAEGGDSAGVGF